jgi:hypothetical protein
MHCHEMTVQWMCKITQSGASAAGNPRVSLHGQKVRELVRDDPLVIANQHEAMGRKMRRAAIELAHLSRQ